MAEKDQAPFSLDQAGGTNVRKLFGTNRNEGVLVRGGCHRSQSMLHINQHAPQVFLDGQGCMILNQMQRIDDEYLGSPYVQTEHERLTKTASYLPKTANTDPTFNVIGQLVCKLFDMPLGAVTMLASQYAVLKGACGIDQACVSVLGGMAHASDAATPTLANTQTTPSDRKLSLCNWLLLPLHPEALVISDLAADGRYASYPLVRGNPHMRFYAAAPLVTSTGFRFGTVYVVLVVLVVLGWGAQIRFQSTNTPLFLMKSHPCTGAVWITSHGI